MTTRSALWNAAATSAAMLLILLFVDPAGRAPEWARFMARQHPAIVHLPIGFLLFGGLLAAFRRWQKEDQPGRVEQAALVLGGWGGVAAAAAGSWLIQMGGYPTDALFWHRVLGFVIPLAAAGTVLANVSAPTRGLRGASWTLLVGSLIVGGHLGGEMTHGKAFAAEYTPGMLKPLVGDWPTLETRFDLSQPETSSVYEVIVVPILRTNCTSCHGEGRTKGGLDLATADAIAAHETDTEDDPLITWGDAQSSLLIQRIVLPIEHPRAMPPYPDAKPLSHADVELLRWWVDSGAGFEKPFSAVARPEAIEHLLGLYGLGDILTGVFALDLPQPDSSAIAEIKDWGVTISYVAADMQLLEWGGQDSSPLHEMAVTDRIKEHVVSVDLSGGNASDADVTRLGDFPHLASVDLSRTAVTGSTLAHLAGLEYLTRLNLYGTRVDDAALEHLANLSALESVYLWQTNVTDEGVARLRDALPNAEINFGE